MNSSNQHKQMQTYGETAVSTTTSCRQQSNPPTSASTQAANRHHLFAAFLFGKHNKRIC
ncbi:MAG: hypothetical protein IPJ90_21895 [Anaerolineaceae bacterium]|nr:hypothetical protein [Anaerolineaceae bacterium]